MNWNLNLSDEVAPEIQSNATNFYKLMFSMDFSLPLQVALSNLISFDI